MQDAFDGTLTLAPQRNVAKLLAGLAVYYHRDARDGQAVEALRDLWAQSEALLQESSIISHFTADAIRQLALAAVEEITPTLRIHGAVRDSRTYLAAAPRESVERLIADLLDETGVQESLMRGLYADRMAEFDALRITESGSWGILLQQPMIGPPPVPWWSRALMWPVRPLLRLDGYSVLRKSAQVIDAGRAATHKAANDLLPPERDFSSAPSRIVHPLSAIYVFPSSQLFVIHNRLLAQTRMAAIALAVRMFEIDHGRRPASLSDLVPDYLPRIPTDPFGAPGRPIGYHRTGDWPRLFCIGDDGVDDKGALGTWPQGSLNRRLKDMPFFLDGAPSLDEDISESVNAESSHSTQAGDNERDVADDQGDADQRDGGDDEP